MDLKEIKAFAKEKDYKGFILYGDTVYFKKLGHVISKEELEKKSGSSLWVYDPSKD